LRSLLICRPQHIGGKTGYFPVGDPVKSGGIVGFIVVGGLIVAYSPFAFQM